MRAFGTASVSLITLLLLFFPYPIVHRAGAMLLTTLVCAWGYTRVLSRGVVVRRSATVIRAARREEASAEFTLTNRSPLPASSLLVVDRGRGRYAHGRERFAVTLRRGESASFVIPLETDRRGITVLGPLEISGCDPFGFFPWRRADSRTCRLVVYPRILDPGSIIEGGDPVGPHPGYDPVDEDPTRLRSIREYRPGDPLNRIHWKATARSGELQVREFERSLTAPGMILLDFAYPAYPVRRRYTLMERCLEAAASLTADFQRAGRPVGFVSDGIRNGEPVLIPVAPGSATEILESLAGLTPASGDGTPPFGLMEAAGYIPPPGSRLLLITPAIEESTIDELERFRKRRMRPHIISPTAFSRNGTPLPDWCAASRLLEYGGELLK